MIAPRCPHEGSARSPGELLCARCEEAGAAVVRLAPRHLPAGVLFESSPAKRLCTQEMRELLGTGAADEALVERKLATEAEAFFRYEEDPQAAEREAYEEALAWRINLRLSGIVDDEEFGPAALVVVPGDSASSWAAEILRVPDDEIRRALLPQKTARWGPPPRTPAGALMMLFVAESHDAPEDD